MYSYFEERPKLFLEENQAAFLAVRDNVKKLLVEAGAFMGLAPFKNVSVSDSFLMLAMLDRLVELGDIREITTIGNTAGQYRVFVSGKNS